MPQPLVSIVLPVRNALTTLTKCLDSIACQSLNQFELIVIDDGSNDGSDAFLASRVAGDSRIRLFTQPALGLVSALNLGLKRARGYYIARMDADDEMYPQRLCHQVHYLRTHPQIGLVASQVNVVSQSQLTDGFKEYIRWQNNCLTVSDITDEIYVESPVAHPTVMFKRCLIDKVGGYRQGPFPEDYDLWLRMIQSGVKMAKLPKVLLDWQDHQCRASRTDKRYSRAAFDELRAKFLATDERLNTLRPLVYWGAGRRTRQRANLLIEKGYMPAVWIDIDPRKIGNKILNAPVVEPQWLKQHSDVANKPFILSYVTNHGAREEIASQLQRYNYQRGNDYLMVG